MVPLPDPSPEELAALRTRLLGAAGRELQQADREDLAQDALVKVVREVPREGAPSLTVRGLAALKQAKVDHFRRSARAKNPPLQLVGEMPEVVRQPSDAGILALELEDVLRRQLGDDVLEFAKARAEGLTEADIAALPGWSPQRAGAARKALQRGHPIIRQALLDD